MKIDNFIRILEELGWCAHVIILVNSVTFMMVGGWLGFMGGLCGVLLVMLFRTIDIWDLNDENGRRTTKQRKKK